MAVLVQYGHGQIYSQLTKSLERILEEAHQSGELKLSNRKLKEFPNVGDRYNLRDTVNADLSKNRFSELPEQVTTFPFLESLQCCHNIIRLVPNAITNLHFLSFLDLSRNNLTCLPRELCRLPIRILLVSNNYLLHLPDDLHCMTQLNELDASSNRLTHLPTRMNEMRDLQSLILRNNLLLDLPIDLTFLDLTRLDLRANRIGTLPIEMRDMNSLIELQVDDNPLTSPPASLCKRGRVHIFKYLETEAIKLDKKCGNTGGTLSRRNRQKPALTGQHAPATPIMTAVHHQATERLKLNKRQNVDSGYSTGSDCNDKRWSQEIICDNNSEPMRIWNYTSVNGDKHVLDTSTTTSSSPDTTITEHKSISSTSCGELNAETIVMSTSEEKIKSLDQIQTYREFKEALKQQRAQDVSNIYRIQRTTNHHGTQDDNTSDQRISARTEPNTPTHHPNYMNHINVTGQHNYYASTSNVQPNNHALATSKSDPTPLNSLLLNGSNGMSNLVTTNGDSEPDFGTEQQHQSVISTGRDNVYTTPSNRTNSLLPHYVKPQSPIACHNNSPLAAPPTKNSNGTPPRHNIHASNYNNKMAASTPLNGIKKTMLSHGWHKDDKLSFTMRREIDKAKEESELIMQLRNIIETKLKMTLPDELASALTDGVVLCHLANHIKPRSVASIHVPSPAVPKLTMARCRRNVDNFIEACRRIGVDEEWLCTTDDVLHLTAVPPTDDKHANGFDLYHVHPPHYNDGLYRVYRTVRELCFPQLTNPAPIDIATPTEHQSIITLLQTQPSLTVEVIAQPEHLYRSSTGFNDCMLTMALLTLFFGVLSLLAILPPRE